MDPIIIFKASWIHSPKFAPNTEMVTPHPQLRIMFPPVLLLPT